MSYEMSTFVAAANQILTLDDIQSEITATITKVQLLLRVNSFYTLTLLLKFKWDIDALKESFHASKSFNDFFIANNLSLKIFPAAPTDPECQLCCATENVEGLACRHMACAPCWKTYLKNKIELGNPSIECFDCSLLICNDKMEALLDSPELSTAYQKRIPRSVQSVGHPFRRMGVADLCIASTVSINSVGFAVEPGYTNGIICVAFLENLNVSHFLPSICTRSIHFYSQKAKNVRPNPQSISLYLHPFNLHKQKLESNHESSSISECRRALMYSYVYAYNQEPGKITEDFEQQQKKLNAELDLGKSKQSVKKCEQLRKSILGYCSSSRTGKGVEETKSEKCCCIILAVFLVLFLCLILAGIVTVSVLLFNCKW
ncbi:hypothetical protein CAEBREN_21421 [Caenorhabditis brenneri]|uniref:Uncharacterized protein n=1 Tax=Caenorhabditis brenneri TaxID=135651 RepID=G0MMK1_CAEBE|nr:hypothetical protein CAEBREN_21421 [Caenorhabditis brenneri]